MTSDPVISMLWERGDPRKALSSRFGFTDASAAVSWLGETVWDIWAMPIDDCDRLVISGTNVLAWITSRRERFIAKWSVARDLFQRLADTAALTAWLDTQGVSVVAPVATTDGRLRVVVDGALVGVSPVVDGELLDVDDPSQVSDAGQTLAALHESLASYPYTFDSEAVTERRRLVHNDYRSANILHDGTSITAVLDFEEVAYRTRVADLAKAAVMLATRYHGWAPTSPAVREAFIAAYDDRSPLTSSEQDELHHVMAAVLDHFGWT
jgi:homoserine kinase type II